MMKKSILLIVAIFLIAISSFAQKNINNEYMSMSVPEGWNVEEINIAGAGMKGVYFTNSIENAYNIGTILFLNQRTEPSMMLEYFCKVESVELIKGARFSEQYQSTFMNKKAIAVNFEKNTDSGHFKGTIYAFNEGNFTVLCIGAYKVGYKSTLPVIWRSIQWKEFVENEKHYNSLKEEAEAFVESMNPIWAASPVESEGELLIKMRVDDSDTPCLVYVKKVIQLSVSSIRKENIGAVADAVKANLIVSIKNIMPGSPLINRWVIAGYNIKYEYLDKDDMPLMEIFITPDDLTE